LQVLDSKLHADFEGDFAHLNLSDYLSSKLDSFVGGKIKFTLKQPKVHILDDALVKVMFHLNNFSIIQNNV